MNYSTSKTLAESFHHYTKIPIWITCGGQFRFSTMAISSEEFELLKKEIHVLSHIDISSSNTRLLSDGNYMMGSFTLNIEKEEYNILMGPTRITGASALNIKDTDLPDFQEDIIDSTEAEFKIHVSFALQYFTHTPLASKSLDFTYLDKSVISKKSRFTNILNYRRIEGYTKDSYQMELKLIHYIKTQNIEKIKWIIKTFKSQSKTSLAKDSLQSLRLKYVAFVTILTRTAIEDGKSIETAFSLSDSLIEEMDSMTSTDRIFEYFIETASQFMQLYQLDNSVDASRDIKQIFNYINRHITSKITLEDLGDYISRTPTYISYKFKKEVGKSLSDYILEKKINEAKEMLLFTNLTSQEIADKLNFNSQSYFIKRFRDNVGKTPKAFRAEHWNYTIWE